MSPPAPDTDHSSPNGRLAAAAPAVSVKGLAKRYGEIEAVREIDFEVARSEVFGFLGPNGAGKSTTINMLCTLVRPTGGSALVAGHDIVRERDAVRRNIGLVFQDTTLDGYLTAEQNLRLHAELYGVPRDAVAPRMQQVMEMVGLWERRASLVGTFSGGMRRRLEIARGLLHSPRVLFLDEPTVGLDPTARRMVWERLHALREQVGTTIVVTTHMMEEAERHCDRLAVIDRGRLVEQGEPGELLERHGTQSLEEVFTTVTGAPPSDGDDEEGRLSDVRAQRRVARRLG
jgi:ABC-2 type transport system ATP-binding protein